MTIIYHSRVLILFLDLLFFCTTFKNYTGLIPRMARVFFFNSEMKRYMPKASITFSVQKMIIDIVINSLLSCCWWRRVESHTTHSLSILSASYIWIPGLASRFLWILRYIPLFVPFIWNYFLLRGFLRGSHHHKVLNGAPLWALHSEKPLLPGSTRLFSESVLNFDYWPISTLS